MIKEILKFFKKFASEPKKEIEKKRVCKNCYREISGPKQKKFCSESCKKKYRYFINVIIPREEKSKQENQESNT